MTNQAKITLLGAGIGDPDLITLKGIKALQMADVVLYDALANDELLGYAPENCVKIYVGKRSKNHSYSQEEINQMLIDYALKYGHVVRLKGGDPYVFGRGYEELEAAKAVGIPVEVIPGISSAIAAPLSAGIPVTKRGMSDSFWVFTGNTTEGGTPAELETAIQTDATIVILMGVGKLNSIVEEYKKIGKWDMPIAVIQNASLPHQKVAIGTMETIENEVINQSVGTPAVIVIGKVAALGISDFGFRVSETTAKTQNSKLKTQNPLFPVFLKLHELKLLIVGGGYVGLEKVTTVLQNSPQTDITLVAPEIREEIVQFSKDYPNLKLIYKTYDKTDLKGKELVIVATNDKAINKQIKEDSKKKRLLCNVADTPDECDFYLSSVVKKGSLKLAISTNGKSPTMAKRIREALEDVFPDDLETAFTNLQAIRATIKGDFEEKVRVLNEITTIISEKNKACTSVKCVYPTCSWDRNTEGCPYFKYEV